jgi:hypothetical protein
MSERARRQNTWPPVGICVVLILWAWHRLGFFTMSRLVPTGDGRVVRAPNGLATVDHPFHAERLHVLLQALQDGYFPRWIFSHQGGYPAEFYPLGGAFVDLGVWLLTFGQMSVPMVHTWAVAAVLALPAVGFFAIARMAHLNPWLPVVVTAGHLCVRGWWWSGGSMELIEWGLITNVLAAMLVFLSLPAIAVIVDRGSRRWMAVAAVLIGWAEVTNPRSALAVASVVVAAVIVIGGRLRTEPVRLIRLLTVLVLGGGLSAPVLVPLIRYRDLYYFVNYSRYDRLIDWWHSTVQAVSTPFLIAALIGLPIALFSNGPTIERLLGWTLVLYVVGTLYLVEIDWPATWTEQLETTRLMPFQRLLMFAVAAIALGRLFDRIPALLGDALGPLLVLAVLTLYIWAPPSFIPESDRGLIRLGTTAEPGIVDLHAAVEAADVRAQPGSALLILGSTVSWHDQMWANLWTERLLFYDDWLWYWQTQHVGDYDPLTEHAYRLDSSTINEDYLHTHGIGAIVVTGEARPAAASAPFLIPVRTGIYDVYLVTRPTTLATLDGSNVSSRIDGERIRIDGTAAGGTLIVRENWFPRWTATVAGKSVPVRHRTDGYMEVAVPTGTSGVTLTYSETNLDWFAWVLASGAGLVVLGLVGWPRPTARSVPRESLEPIAPAQI